MRSDDDDFASDFARGLGYGFMDLLTLGTWRLFRRTSRRGGSGYERDVESNVEPAAELKPAEFLSPVWFDNVAALTTVAGDLDIPPALADLILNITATDTPWGRVEMSLFGGCFERGHNRAAMTAITLPAAMLRKVFFEGDAEAGLEGFSAGLITLEGDMSGLMALQSARPSAAYVALTKRIMALTR